MVTLREWTESGLNMHERNRPKSLATPEGLEPPTLGSEDQCSIQLSYGAALSDFTIERSDTRAESATEFH